MPLNTSQRLYQFRVVNKEPPVSAFNGGIRILRGIELDAIRCDGRGDSTEWDDRMKRIIFAMTAMTAIYAIGFGRARAAVHVVDVSAVYPEFSSADLGGTALSAKFTFDDATLPEYSTESIYDPSYKQYYFKGSDALAGPVVVTNKYGTHTFAPQGLTLTAERYPVDQQIFTIFGSGSNSDSLLIYLGSLSPNFITSGLPKAAPASFFYGNVTVDGQAAFIRKFLFDVSAGASTPAPTPTPTPTPLPNLPESPLLGLSKEQIKSAASILEPAMGTLSKVLDIGALYYGGTKDLGKNVAKYLLVSTVGAAKGGETDDWSPRDPLSKFYSAARDVMQTGKVLPVVLELMASFADDDAKMLQQIVRDPADPNFMSVFSPTSLNVDYPKLATVANGQQYLSLLNSMAQYHADLLGLLTAAERYDGANGAGDTDSRRLQYAAFNQYLAKSGADASLINSGLASLASILPDHDLTDFGSNPSGVISAAIAAQCSSSLPSDIGTTLSGLGLAYNPSTLDACTNPTATDLPNLKLALTTPSDALAGFTAAAAVPEPNIWLTMVAGFGAIGLALRRRPLTESAVM